MGGASYSLYSDMCADLFDMDVATVKKAIDDVNAFYGQRDYYTVGHSNFEFAPNILAFSKSLHKTVDFCGKKRSLISESRI